MTLVKQHKLLPLALVCFLSLIYYLFSDSATFDSYVQEKTVALSNQDSFRLALPRRSVETTTSQTTVFDPEMNFSNESYDDNITDGYITTPTMFPVHTRKSEAMSLADVSGWRPRLFNEMKLPWEQTNIALPYNKTLVREQQIERHNRIHNVCDNLPKKSIADSLYRTSRIQGVGNLLYCPILKAGSTNVLRLFCWLLGPPCSEIQNLHPHNQVPKYLDAPKKPWSLLAKQQDINTFSWAIVRNPWTRLVSVYIQKFVETKQGLVFCKIRERRPKVFKRLRRSHNWELTFTEYLRNCVLGQWAEGGFSAQNPHWRPQHLMCNFCHMDYSFIGKMETMVIDENVFLHEFGFGDIDATRKAASKKLLPNEKAHKTTLLYNDLWAEVPEKMINTLKQIYKTDFLMFDYSSNP